MSRAPALGALAAAIAAAAWTVLVAGRRGARAAARGGALIVAGAAWLENGTESRKELVLVATLAAAAAAGRVLFAAVPNVQPVTVMVVVAGVALGPRAGMAVGALAAFVSNFFLGQGAYTPWQMLAWGACGVLGGLAAPLLRRRLPLALTCFALGFAFACRAGCLGVAQLLPAHVAGLRGALVRGISFNVAHATGNSCSRSWRGLSCAGCSSATRAGSGRR